MKRLLEYAEFGDTVVVWRIDRLGRSLMDVLNTVNPLRESRVKIRSVSDGIDPETSSERMMLGMLATLAEYERDLIIERVGVGIAAAKANGTRFGRPPVGPHVVAAKLEIVNDARARCSETPAPTPDLFGPGLAGTGRELVAVQRRPRPPDQLRRLLSRAPLRERASARIVASVVTPS